MRTKTATLWVKLILSYTFIVFICTFYLRGKLLLVHTGDNTAQGLERENNNMKVEGLDDMMKRVDAVHAQRRSQLQKTCRELGYSSTPTREQKIKALRTLIVYEPHRALICLMAKVASTSWKVELGLLSNLTHIDRDSVSHRNVSWWHRVYSKDILKSYGIFSSSDYTDDQKIAIIETYHSFMFTRHPLERQVSAYRSKFVIGNDATYSMFYSIVRGHKPPAKFNGTSDVSFREFITYVADRLIRGKRVNEHMDTYERLCEPCAINYDFLGDMATMKDDVTYVITKMTGHKYTGNMFSMYSPEKTQESEKVFLSFCKDLDKDLIKKIDKAFERDYKLFGYKSLWTLLGYDNTITKR